jgi:hypothetical protein
MDDPASRPGGALIHAASLVARREKIQQIRGPGRMVKLTLTLTADNLSANRLQSRIFLEGFVKET